MTLRDKTGTVVDVQSLVLPAGQYLSEPASDRFPAAGADFEGSVEFTSVNTRPRATGLRRDNADQDVFTAIPVFMKVESNGSETVP